MGRNAGQDADSSNETTVSPTSPEEPHISTDPTTEEQPLRSDNTKSGKFFFSFPFAIFFSHSFHQNKKKSNFHGSFVAFFFLILFCYS